MTVAKNKKKRNCPALGRVIERVECAQWRHREVECPGDCEHNPFAPANYALYSEMEGRLAGASLRKLLKEGSGPTVKAIARAAESGNDEDLLLHSIKGLYFERDARGASFAERWLADPKEKWKNDERLFFEGIQRIRPAFLEVRAVLDDTRVEVLDLLHGGERLLLCDKMLAERACRFDCLFAWVFPLPHFWRFNGMATPYMSIGDFDPFGVFCELVRHHGGDPETVGDDPDWLFENLPVLNRTRERIRAERRRRTISGMDLKYWYGNYRDAGPDGGAELVARFDLQANTVREEPEAEEGEESPWETDRWTLLGGESPSGLGRSVLGNIRYNAFKGQWRVDAMTRPRFETLTAAFNKVAATGVRMTGEEYRDLAAELNDERSEEAADDLPPALLEATAMAAADPVQMRTETASETDDDDISRQLFRNWLNAEIPALGGKKPSEAAKDPDLAEAVLHRVKEQINAYDQGNLNIGRTGDVGDLLREHGLPDPGEPPPPKRPPRRSLTDPDPEAPPETFPMGAPDTAPEAPPESPFASDEEAEEDDDLDLREFCEEMADALTEFAETAEGPDRDYLLNQYQSLPMAQPPQETLLTDALKEGPIKELNETDNPGQILARITAGTGPDFLAALDAFLHELEFKDEERGAFCIAMMLMWVCLVPRGHRKPLLSLDDLRRRFFGFDFPPPETFDHSSELLACLCYTGPQEEVCLLSLMQYLRMRPDFPELEDPAKAFASSYPALLLLRVLCDCWAGEHPD